MKAAGDEFDALLFSVVMTAVGEDVTYVCSSITFHTVICGTSTLEANITQHKVTSAACASMLALRVIKQNKLNS